MTTRFASSLLFLFSLSTAIGCGTTISGDLESEEESEEDSEEDDGTINGYTPCATPDRVCGEYGDEIQYCFLDEDGAETWTECCYIEFSPECECPAPWADLDEDVDCNTPLVLSFDQRAVSFTSEPGATFNLTRESETSVQTDWPTSATPWLALDLNQNGAIDHGAELFGSATQVGDGFAPNGFIALGALDDNHDGVIDSADSKFSELLIWRDADHSRSSEPAELSPASLELLAIDLAYGIDRRCDDRGNCEVERAAFRTLDEHGQVTQGAVVDVHLRRQ